MVNEHKENIFQSMLATRKNQWLMWGAQVNAINSFTSKTFFPHSVAWGLFCMQQECTTKIYRLLGGTVWELQLQCQWHLHIVGEHSWHWRARCCLPGTVIYLLLQSHGFTTWHTRLPCCSPLPHPTPVPDFFHACASGAGAQNVLS